MAGPHAHFQLSEPGDHGGAFSYDGMGNATRWLHYQLANTAPSGQSPQMEAVAQHYALGYTASGQLRQVNELESDGSVGDVRQVNGYRGDGLRAWKQNHDGQRTYFYYDGSQRLGSVNVGSDGELASPRQVLWGANGLVGTRWREDTTERAGYCLFDTQGNLVQSYREDGHLSKGEASLAWGEGVPESSTTGEVGTSNYGAQYGNFSDGETGFVLCTYRFYDPSQGTWISRDPISYAGGQNLYGYVDGDPVNQTDPSGLDSLVEVNARFVSGTGWTGATHTFTLIWPADSHGVKIKNSHPYYIGGNNGNGNLVAFHARYGPNMPNSTDYDQNPEDGYIGPIFTLHRTGCADAVYNRLSKVVDKINDSLQLYNGVGVVSPNSNSVTWTVIREGLGINIGETAFGPYVVPGWGLWADGGYSYRNATNAGLSLFKATMNALAASGARINQAKIGGVH